MTDRDPLNSRRPAADKGAAARPETEVERGWRRVYETLIVRGAQLALAVTVIGSVVGYFVSGGVGVIGGLVGGGVAGVFMLVSLVVMFIGRGWQIHILAAALGFGFLLKAVIFMIVIWRIRDATWLDGTVAFFTIVAAVIGTSLIEAITVSRARVPVVDPDAR